MGLPPSTPTREVLYRTSSFPAPEILYRDQVNQDSSVYDLEGVSQRPSFLCEKTFVYMIYMIFQKE